MGYRRTGTLEEELTFIFCAEQPVFSPCAELTAIAVSLNSSWNATTLTRKFIKTLIVTDRSKRTYLLLM